MSAQPPNTPGSEGAAAGAPAQDEIVLPGDVTTQKGRIKRVRIIVPIVIGLMVVVIAARSLAPKPTAVAQRPGIDLGSVQQGDPTTAPKAIADDIKAKDEHNANAIASSRKAINSGASYLPTVTNEYENPLGQFATPAGARQQNAALPEAPPPPPQVQAVAYNPNAQPSGGRNDVTGAQLMVESISKFRQERENRLKVASHSASVATEEKGKAGSTAGEPSTSAAADGGAPGQDPTKKGRVFARLGSLIYAALDLEANSDASDFIQATVAGGPYDGAKVQGRFERKGEAIEMRFNRLAWNGGTYNVNAIAVNPDEPKVSLASEVNHHYISRYGGLFVGASLAAVGQAVTQIGSTTVAGTGVVTNTVPTKTPVQYGLIGAGAVGTELANSLREGVNRPPTVIVHASTPIGLLFVSDWIETPDQKVPDAPSAGVLNGPSTAAASAAVPPLDLQNAALPNPQSTSTTQQARK